MSFPPIDDVYTHLPTMLRDLLLSPGESHHPLHSSRSAPSLHVSPPSTPSTSPPLKSRIRAPHSPKKSFSVTFSPSPPQERSFEVNEGTFKINTKKTSEEEQNELQRGDRIKIAPDTPKEEWDAANELILQKIKTAQHQKNKNLTFLKSSPENCPEFFDRIMPQLSSKKLSEEMQETLHSCLLTAIEPSTLGSSQDVQHLFLMAQIILHLQQDTSYLTTEKARLLLQILPIQERKNLLLWLWKEHENDSNIRMSFLPHIKTMLQESDNWLSRWTSHDFQHAQEVAVTFFSAYPDTLLESNLSLEQKEHLIATLIEQRQLDPIKASELKSSLSDTSCSLDF